MGGARPAVMFPMADLSSSSSSEPLPSASYFCISSAVMSAEGLPSSFGRCFLSSSSGFTPRALSMGLATTSKPVGSKPHAMMSLCTAQACIFNSHSASRPPTRRARRLPKTSVFRSVMRTREKCISRSALPMQCINRRVGIRTQLRHSAPCARHVSRPSQPWASEAHLLGQPRASEIMNFTGQVAHSEVVFVSSCMQVTSSLKFMSLPLPKALLVQVAGKRERTTSAFSCWIVLSACANCGLSLALHPAGQSFARTSQAFSFSTCARVSSDSLWNSSRVTTPSPLRSRDSKDEELAFLPLLSWDLARLPMSVTMSANLSQRFRLRSSSCSCFSRLSFSAACLTASCSLAAFSSAAFVGSMGACVDCLSCPTARSTTSRRASGAPPSNMRVRLAAGRPAVPVWRNSSQGTAFTFLKAGATSAR
mmetsp:Transcript_25114/g.78859  ORF Transcript_25114/g.78859 Transcript_25114/m.78859 type:complete len:422 (-) Transcript_25114:321-1586(-)